MKSQTDSFIVMINLVHLWQGLEKKKIGEKALVKRAEVKKKEEYKYVAEIKGICYLCQYITNWDEHLEQYKYHEKQPKS